jgi:hypothetical protein
MYFLGAAVGLLLLIACVLTVETELPQGRYEQDPAVRQFYSDLIARPARVDPLSAIRAE